jgi:hypothetical protein
MVKNNNATNIILRRFILKNLLRNLVLNICFNGILPYSSLKNFNSVHLFQGPYCIARFLLPMALLLPFFITLDTLKRLNDLLVNSADFVMPDKFISKKAMLKTSGIYSLLIGIIVFAAMLFLQMALPANYGYSGSMVCFFLGLSASIMSVVFTLLPVRLFIKTVSFVIESNYKNKLGLPPNR